MFTPSLFGASRQPQSHSEQQGEGSSSSQSQVRGHRNIGDSFDSRVWSSPSTNIDRSDIRSSSSTMSLDHLSLRNSTSLISWRADRQVINDRRLRIRQDRSEMVG